MQDKNDLEKLTSDLESLRRQIEGYDRRISALERRLRPLVWLRRKLRPTLWKFEQYAPRELRLPSTYDKQTLPQQVPPIAIVTPSFNSVRYLSYTIDSVLTQTYPRLSYWVQDGGSTDGTQELLKSYGERLNWRSEPDNGQADAINKGFDSVRGDIMGYINSDDILLPGALSFVARTFDAHPDVDIVYGHRITIDAAGKEIGRIILPPHDNRVIPWADYIPQETMFWRRRVWDQVGPTDACFQFAMDWDFILRARAAGFKFRRLNRFLACFRVHDAQKTTAMADVGEDEQRRLRKIHLGTIPDAPSIELNIKRYLQKQTLYHRLYKARIIKI